MDEVKPFFVGPYWAALTGTVTLLSAIVPLVVAIWRRTEPRRSLAAETPTGRVEVGCGSLAMSVLLNTAAYFFYGMLINGFWFSILGLSPKRFRDDYYSAYGNIFKFDSFVDMLSASCGFTCLSGGLVIGLFVSSTVAALRYGYDFGVYTLVLGMSLVGFPLNLLLISSIPAYAALPTASKFYIIGVSVLSSLLASIAILAIAWFTARSIYRPSFDSLRVLPPNARN